MRKKEQREPKGGFCRWGGAHLEKRQVGLDWKPWRGYFGQLGFCVFMRMRAWCDVVIVCAETTEKREEEVERLFLGEVYETILI